MICGNLSGQSHLEFWTSDGWAIAAAVSCRHPQKVSSFYGRTADQNSDHIAVVCKMGLAAVTTLFRYGRFSFYSTLPHPQ